MMCLIFPAALAQMIECLLAVGEVSGSILDHIASYQLKTEPTAVKTGT